MKITQLPFGPIEANCYLIETKSASVLIDPCVSLSELPELASPLKAIIITHCHYDHISCLEEVRNVTKAPVYCHSLEFSSFRDPVKNGSALFLMEETFPLPDVKIEGGEDLFIGDGINLHFMHTPGHTMGSICILLSENKKNTVVFTGDTLFQGSAGRTDLGGNPVLLQKSLSELKKLEKNILVYSGHGPSSTIGEEIRSNPFLSM